MLDPSLKSGSSSFTRKNGLRTIVANRLSKSSIVCSSIAAAFEHRHCHEDVQPLADDRAEPALPARRPLPAPRGPPAPASRRSRRARPVATSRPFPAPRVDNRLTGTWETSRRTSAYRSSIALESPRPG